MKLHYKSESIREQFTEAPTLLQEIVADFVRLSNDAGIIPVMTRAWDPVEGESGVHTDKRAVDFRDEHGGRFLYEDSLRDRILRYINSKYCRSDGKVSIIWHNFKDGQPHHFHIQQAPSQRAYIRYTETNGTREIICPKCSYHWKGED